MKTKVIAFRVSQDEYDALYFAARSNNRKVGELVYSLLAPGFPEAMKALAKERKKVEAKAKRQALKEAASGL